MGRIRKHSEHLYEGGRAKGWTRIPQALKLLSMNMPPDILHPSRPPSLRICTYPSRTHCCVCLLSLSLLRALCMLRWTREQYDSAFLLSATTQHSPPLSLPPSLLSFFLSLYARLGFDKIYTHPATRHELHLSNGLCLLLLLRPPPHQFFWPGVQTVRVYLYSDPKFGTFSTPFAI